MHLDTASYFGVTPREASTVHMSIFLSRIVVVVVVVVVIMQLRYFGNVIELISRIFSKS